MGRMPDPGDRAWSPDYLAAPAGHGQQGVRLAHASAGIGGPPDASREDLRRPRRVWSGAGGRWLLWPLRAVLWAALLIIVYRGVTAIVMNDTSASPGSASAGAVATSDQFPVTLAEAYALEFGQVYLNATPATQAQREQELAPFVPPSLAASNPDLGWNGSGQVHLQSEQVAGIDVQDRQHAVVSLLATVSGQLMELGVPVYASGGGVVVSGAPAWLPAPQPISVPSAAAPNTDPVAQGELQNQLPAFFQAYANGSGSALNRFLASGVTLAGLNGAVAFDSIQSLEVPRGGATRHITVTVIWQLLDQDGLTSAKFAMTYSVSVIDLHSGKWYVIGISASTEAVGAR
jgi:Conjugative transposon protein TcpC